jgi:predicted unusual protein kinase regulating ubiquinone biosynthesis (AarF/ABC1/UbiB family)
LSKSSTQIGARRQVAPVLPASPEVTTERQHARSAIGGAHRFRWQRAKYSLSARQLDIFASVAKWLPILVYNRLFPNQNDRYHRRLGQALVDTTIGLGPTFIKIGQSLSTRVDFFSPIYTEALSQLQDRVPAFSVEEAIAIIESELGAPLSQLFTTFDPIPIAAASLGQVHRAKLRTGDAVVVKIQRPGLERLFQLDFRVIDKLLWWVGLLLPAKRSRELRAIYQEFFMLLFQEIDYTKEGQNADRFRENFRDNERVTAPTIYWRFTTPKVLTMSYLPGIKIDDRATLEACGFDPKQINQLGICCYLKQLLVDGFFQADPHPGNMAIATDGRLVVYDFGMMAELKEISTTLTIETFWAVMKKDSQAVIAHLIEMGLLVEMADMQPIERLIEFLLERFTDRPVDVREFDAIKREMTALFIHQPFQISPEMSFILKALSTLDGIARTLDPEYNLVAAAQPFLRSVAIAERGNIVSNLGKQVTSFLKYRLTRPSAHKLHIQQLERRLAHSERETARQAKLNVRSLQLVNLAIANLGYLGLTGVSALVAIYLIPLYPTLSWLLWGIPSLCGLIWLGSIVGLLVKTRHFKRSFKSPHND